MMLHGRKVSKMKKNMCSSTHRSIISECAKADTDNKQISCTKDVSSSSSSSSSLTTYTKINELFSDQVYNLFDLCANKIECAFM